MNRILPHKLVYYIARKIHPPIDAETMDKPWLMLEARGEFSVRST